MVRVLIVTPVYPPLISVGGGVAITYGQLYDKLIARGNKVTVLSGRLYNVDHCTTNLYSSFPILLPSLANLKLFYRHFKENDVVVCPDTTLLPFLLFFSHLTETPLLCNLHTNFRMVLEGGSWAGRNLAAPIMDTFCGWTSRIAPLCYTTSPSYKAVCDSRGYKVDGVFSPRIKLGVFEEKDDPKVVAEARKWLTDEAPEEKKGSVLIFIGRWSHEKRIHLLVKCKPSNCVLAIVGDGPKKEADKIDELHDPANGVVVKRGMVNQERLRVLYKASDYLVSASAFETLGMTVAEAHLCGTPVIVQNAAGFITQVVEGENGFLVDFDDPETYLPVVQKAVDHPPSAAQIRKTVEQRWDGDLENLDDVVEKMATLRKEDWNCIKPPMWLAWIMVVLHFVAYRIMSWPFLVDKKYVVDWRGKLKNPAGSDRLKKIR